MTVMHAYALHLHGCTLQYTHVMLVWYVYIHLHLSYDGVGSCMSDQLSCRHTVADMLRQTDSRLRYQSLSCSWRRALLLQSLRRFTQNMQRQCSSGMREFTSVRQYSTFMSQFAISNVVHRRMHVSYRRMGIASDSMLVAV